VSPAHDFTSLAHAWRAPLKYAGTSQPPPVVETGPVGLATATSLTGINANPRARDANPAITARTGDVSGFAPPGDIHRVRNAGERTAISIHVYGTDVSRIGTSARRYYDLPVVPARPAA
jgi:hypothetical protein